MAVDLASNFDFRFERKYHIVDLPSEEIVAWVLRCPALFREAFPPRYINNIYFDTPSLGNYFQNLDGVANRTKIRIRWYGDLFGRSTRPVLEYKIKRGMVGTKDSHRLQDFDFGEGFGVDDLEEVFAASDLEEDVLRELSFVTPTLVNRYHRKYFISADRTYRITIDTGLEFYQIGKRENLFVVRRPLEGSTVMELKYAGSISELNDGIMNFFPFRVTRMSKYVVGVEMVEL
ncbi:polyphosphate polymerase domain-containing protein [Verrucomicrobia bacterium]|jgi:hypothetical protein|nr:polyphosphate polymerase domain-containing protein [Verrucomicrobiota bacterium]MDA7644840.1 polyphosphate polymerase domain-containing protein [bacterium]MDB4798210.1 polyphosphate polymerase domain-containing protein [Verrucomicrobiota bacterium]